MDGESPDNTPGPFRMIFGVASAHPRRYPSNLRRPPSIVRNA